MSQPACAVVCDRWDMPVDPSSDTGAWFADWVTCNPREASAHITAGMWAYRAARDALAADTAVPGDTAVTAVEYFGGIGCQSLIIQHLFHPAEHLIYERHPAAVAHLRAVFRGREAVRVRQANAYSLGGQPGDLVGLDFEDLTIHKAVVPGNHQDLLNTVFAGQPRAVVLTDTAGPRLHLHRDRYAELMPGFPCTAYPDYLAGLADYLATVYGYYLVRCLYHRWSAVLALVPDAGRAPGDIVPVPPRPRGIVLQAAPETA